MSHTSQLLARLTQNDQDFEWYPTTQEMIDAVLRWLPENAAAILDIGAGDGRVLEAFAKKCTHALLYSIEIASILAQAQPKDIIPVGTDLFEQNLACLQVEYIYCNPRYSEYEEWVCKIISEGFAKRAYLTIPQRWKESDVIASTLKRRGAHTRVIWSGDFYKAERQARAVVDIVEVTFPGDKWGDKVKDPFDIWFDQNIDTFDKTKEVREPLDSKELARRYGNANIEEMVAAYREEYERIETNYRLIFKLDLMLLRELGVDKDHVREGLKKKLAGLKVRYWQLLFKRLDAITSRLTTRSKDGLLARLTGNMAVEFTTTNAYNVVVWAIKNANQYFDEQLVTLFRDLSTFEGVMGYKSNEKTWGRDHWRYMRWTEWEAFKETGGNGGKPRVNHYALDYRIVVTTFNYRAIYDNGKQWLHSHQYPNNLHEDAHGQIADVVAVMNNLGFPTNSLSSYERQWVGGQWQDWHHKDTDRILFQVKGYMNGNLHFRFDPEAIKALNIEAGRLLKWVRTVQEVVEEMGYSPADAKKYFKRSLQLTANNVPLIAAPVSQPAEEARQVEDLPDFSSAQQPTLL